VGFQVDDLPERTPDEWAKGPPAALRERAAAGFARKHGLAAEELEERDGFLWARVAGTELRGDVLLDRLAAIAHGLEFTKSMRWDDSGRRFSRPVRWACEKLDGETLRGSGTSFGHRFTHGEIDVPSSGDYADVLRDADVEPVAEERRRRIVDGLNAFGPWSDPLGKLREVVHMVEWPLVLESAFDERYLALPERVIVTAMQSHQRYFPLGGNRFAVVANGGDPEVTVPGYTRVLENRLEDARFTFERDVAVGIEGLAARLHRITFFAGAGSFADKTERIVALVDALGGDERAREAARLAKADQASELVREFADLEGHIGAEYARLAGFPEDVAVAIDEQFLPDAADAPLPSTEAGRILSAADKLDTLTVSFGLGHRPTGSRDPYGLRRAAIGVCRLALEGGVPIPRRLLDGEVRSFLEERLESLLDTPVEFVRAARASQVETLGDVADLARTLAALEDERLDRLHTVFTRARNIVTKAPGDAGPLAPELLSEPAERAVLEAKERAAAGLAASRTPDEAVAAAEQLADPLARFFDDVLVMAEDADVRRNRLALLASVRDLVESRLGDLSQIPR
jgi:glycyl-tRNA synthetase beta chain